MELVELGRVAKGLPSVMRRAVANENPTVFRNKNTQGKLLKYTAGKEASKILAMSRKAKTLDEKFSLGSSFGTHRAMGEAIKKDPRFIDNVASKKTGKINSKPSW